MEVFNSLRGTSEVLDTASTLSLEELKQNIGRRHAIDNQSILLLVPPSGTQLKDTSAPKVFVYDRQWAHSRDEPVGSGGNATDSEDSGKPEICIEAANLAIANLKHNYAVLLKQLVKFKQTKARLEPDISACGSWRHYYDALRQIPELKAELPELLDYNRIEQNYNELSALWSKMAESLDELSSAYNEIKDKICIPLISDGELTLSEAQKRLVSTLHAVGQVQVRIKLNLRKPLSTLSDSLKQAEELKSQVAKVIDLPFLYGVLLIEASRRRKWKSDFGPIWNRESGRRREWRKTYCTGSVGTLMERLDRIGQFRIVNNDNSEDLDGTFQTDNNESDSDAMTYLQTLEALNLDDVCEDLKSELGAMKRQFARTMTASISSLIPASMLDTLSPAGNTAMNAGPPLPQNANPGIVSAYESRIRKLETIIMQSRLGSKKHELDIIRAETRAEARAEARAEVKAEQQEARIAELERQNSELAGRLHSYVSGLETVLNSMGLQTSRVNPDTGAPGEYQINRVKGLSRNVVPPSDAKTQDSASGGASVASGSESAASGASSDGQAMSQATGSVRTVSIERLLEQTFVDNQVLFDAVSKRFGDVERLARKLQVESRRLRDRDMRMERDLRQRVALHSFRPEDLILFLPTRDTRRQPNPWAAFNARAPHYFLHPKHTEQLQDREYLIARASSIERHVAANDDENIFQLPVGVEWFLISIHGEWGV